MSEAKQFTKKLMRSFGFVFLIFIASLVGVIFVLQTTSPLKLGPQAMLLAYGSFYLLLFTTMLLLLRVWSFFKNSFMQTKQTTEQPRELSVMLAALFALGFLIILALQSIGQLDIVSCLLVLLFEGIACFYILKRK